MKSEFKIDVMIIGAQKSGTTALKNYLAEHPKIVTHPQIEFEGFHEEESLESANFFKYLQRESVAKESAILTKNAAAYADENIIRKIRDHNSDCKLILILRHPVERAYSSYQMENFFGYLKDDFEKVIDVIETKNYDNQFYKSFLRLGHYEEHLRTILNYFPLEQIKIILYDRFVENPDLVCKEVFQWLGQDDTFKPNTSMRYNETRVPVNKVYSRYINSFRSKSNKIKKTIKKIIPYTLFVTLGEFLINVNQSTQKYPPMSENVKKYLINYYKPYNKALEKLLNINLDRWENTNN